MGSLHQKRLNFLNPKPNDTLFSMKSYTECLSGRQFPVTFIFECPPPGCIGARSRRGIGPSLKLYLNSQEIITRNLVLTGTKSLLIKKKGQGILPLALRNLPSPRPPPRPSPAWRTENNFANLCHVYIITHRLLHCQLCLHPGVYVFHMQSVICGRCPF